MLKEPGPQVRQPDNTSITSSGTGHLPLHPSIIATGNHVMILPGLKSSSLLSLGRLCDDDCNIFLSKHHLHTIKDGKIILRGYRNPQDGLWDIPLSTVSPPPPTAQQVQLPVHHNKVNTITHTPTTLQVKLPVPHKRVHHIKHIPTVPLCKPLAL